MEIWKQVVGYEGHYEVSSEGRVRSLDRVSLCGRNALKGRFLSLETTHKGYLRVALTSEGKTTKHSVHRLVLSAFAGPCPGGFEGCHNDGDTTNNVLANLRWGTPKSNWQDKRMHQTARVGEQHPMATISETKAAVIKMELALGFAARLVALWNGASLHVVNQIKSGKTWKHL